MPHIAVIATADGRYRDPWHPFDETTQCLREILEERGCEIRILPVDEALQALEGADLLVVNAGDPWREGAFGAPEASVRGLEAALGRGIGVLALHAASASLRDYAAWAPAIGRVWLPGGVSMHPEIGETTLEWHDHPLAGSEPLTLFDERYSFLQPVGESDVVASHDHDGVTHPLVWTRRHGASRVAVDLLGHSARSFEAPGHRALVGRLIDWATGS